MEKSTNYNFNLPNSANDEIADINDISDNFRIIDEKLKIDQTFSETSENPQSGKAIAGEIGKKQDYFADISDSSQNRDINLTDKNGTAVGQIVVVPTEGIRYTNVITPENETDGTNKKYVDDTTNTVKSYANNSFANALKGSASGEAVRLTDVSPIEHEIKIKLTAESNYSDFSGVTLKRCGRNLVDISDGNSAASANTVDITESCPRGINIVVSAYLARSVNQPCRLRIDYVVDGKTNYLFGEMMYSSGINIVKGTIPISATQVNLTFQKLINSEGDIYWKNVQLEIGDSATDYRAFQQQNYIANADGTVPGVTSISDDITLMTDTAGVIINAEYNRDINKAFAELQQVVLSMGGNT